MKTTALLLSFVFIFLNLQAQTVKTVNDSRRAEIIYQHDNPKSNTLGHVTGDFEHKEHTNKIIRRTGEWEGLNPPTAYRAELKYLEMLLIEKSGEDLRLKASIRFTEIITKGRGNSYDFSSYLLPGGMNFKVELLDASGKVIFDHEVRQTDISSWSREKDVEILGLSIRDRYPHDGLKMRITEIVAPKPMMLFFHKQDQQERFFSYLEMIEEYEKDAALVKEKARQAQGINPDNPENFRRQLDELESYKADVDIVISKNWQTKLRFGKTDPAGLISGLETFASRYNDTKAVLQQGLRTLDDSYYNRGMEFMRRQDYENALIWFKKAVEINPGHARSHFQIATIDFRRGRLEESAARANRILTTMNPDSSLSSQSQNLLKEVHKSIADSYLKIYLSIIAEAEQELSRGKMADALEALNRASIYQHENSKYISSDEKVVELTNKIVRRFSVEAERDVKSGRYKEALDRYEDLTFLFRKNAPRLRIPVYVENRISEILELYVNTIISQALLAMRKDDYKKTGFILSELIHESEKHREIKSSDKINRLLYQYMTDLYNRGQKLLQRRSFAMAFEVFNQCLTLLNEFKLSVPPGFYHSMEEARNGVFAGLLFAGQEAMNRRDFDGAEFYLEEALNFLQNRPTGTYRTALEAYKTNLLNAYISEGKRLIAAMDFERALIVLDRATHSQYTYGILSSVNIPDLILEAREGIGVKMLTRTEALIRKQNYQQAMQSLSEVSVYTADYGLSGSAFKKMINTAEEFYRELLLSTDRAYRGSNYSYALELLDDAKHLCDNYPIGCNNEDIYKTEGFIRQGVYNSIVTDANKVINSGDYDKAESLMEQAEKYRQQWEGYVSTTNEAHAVFGRIRHKYYQQYISQGKSMLDTKDFRQALTNFDEAIILEQEGGFTRDVKLREYRIKAALHTILAEADQLEQMVGKASYMATKDKMLQLMTMRAKYGLQDNKELENRFKSLQSRMVSAACLQQQKIFEEHLENANAFENQREYISAGEEYNLAVAAAKKHPECYLSDSLPIRKLDMIMPAIKYQEKIKLSEMLLRDYKNNEALERYVEAEAIYNQGNIHTFGINHEPLTDYALKQNLNYVLGAAYYFMKRDNMPESLKMLEALSNRGYPPKQTRLLQEQSGFRYGQQDRIKYSSSSWKVAVLQHTSGKKFYKYFRKAYKRGWKSK